VVVYGVDVVVYVASFSFQIFLDSRKEFGPGQPMSRPGGGRREATADLVLALRSWFKSLALFFNAVVDSLVVTGFEMQRVVVRIGAPVSTIQCLFGVVEKCRCYWQAIFFGDNDKKIPGKTCRHLKEKIKTEIGERPPSQKGQANQVIGILPDSMIGNFAAESAERNSLLGNMTSVTPGFFSFDRTKGFKELVET